MKNLVIALAFIFSLNALGQTKPASQTKTVPPSEKVISKPLYTKTEKKEGRKVFLKDVDQMKLSPETKTQYLAIIDKHVARLTDASNSKKLTKKQATDLTHKIIREQNQEVSKILTPDQYQDHLIIINRYENSIVYRIEKQ